MTADQWTRIKPLLMRAAELPAEQRATFLEAHCSDTGLRAELFAMLAAPAPLSDLTGGARSLEPGTLLASYRVEHLLGRGGMGDVYKARDTRLDRDVAIKVLPPALAEDRERLRRFHREAQILAALIHPHVATIYGFEEVSGACFLVMEYIPGQSLAERLASGPLSSEEALRVAVEVGEALEASHRAGIIHRDLKPANVMLGPSGVKLLDFGLARLVLPDPSAAMTVEGAILGTLQYMAPEQLEGRTADERSDLFAFGCVLYEMLAGRRPFDADSQAGIIAAILGREPPALSSVQTDAPVALQHVVARCLAKDPRARWQTATDLLAELRWIASGGVSLRAMPARNRRPLHLGVAWTVAALAALGWFVTVVVGRRPPPDAAVPVPAVLQPPAGHIFGGAHLALSRDGRRLAYRAWQGGTASLWVQAVTTGEAAPLGGTADGVDPFFSPDGRHLGFCDSRALGTIDLDSGSLVKLNEGHPCWGGTWNEAGTLLYSSNGSIHSVPAVGGAPAVVLAPSPPVLVYSDPVFLPDARRFLVVGQTTRGKGVYLADVQTRRAVFLFESSGVASYASPGFLLYLRRAQLFARAFDVNTQKLSDKETLIARAASAFAVSDRGVLAYMKAQGQSELVWTSRTGTRLATLGPPKAYGNPRLSPDGTRLAYNLPYESEAPGLWVRDLRRDYSDVRISAEIDSTPVWSPDGLQLLFTRSWEGLRIGSTTGLGAQREVLRRPVVWPSDWSKDGYIAYTYDERHIIGVRRLDPPGDVELPFPAEAEHFNARFSPDGRWLAYTSNESGKYDVYVLAWPSLGAKWKISTNGGSQSVWRGDGRELFYVASDGKLMSVAVTPQASTPFARPVALFEAPLVDLIAPSFDVSRDGQKLLLNLKSSPDGAALNIVSNWTALLQK